MTVTKRFIVIEALCIPILVASMFFGVTGYIFVIFNLVCGILLAYDFVTAPKKNEFEITRDDNDKLYFKAPNVVYITVRNGSEDDTTVFVKDDIPDLHFKVKDAAGYRISSGEDYVFKYEIMPTKRGSYMFNDVFVKYTGKLGLCYKYFRINLAKEYKVYPNVNDVGKYRLMIQKNRILMQGERRVNIRGAGAEFESLREYVEGDNYRNINWMATARGAKLIVNQYEAEKNQPVYILIDAGRPMSYSYRGYKRLDYAINAAVILADIVNQKGDNCGLIVFDSDVRAVVSPGKGSGHRNLLMDTFYHIADTKDTPDYDGAFMELSQKQSRRSIVFLFTNFETLEEAKRLVESMKILKKRHIPIIVLMKEEGMSLVANSEVSKAALGEAYRKAVAMEFLEERRQIIRALQAHGVFCVESSSERFAIDAVNQYLTVKNKNLL